MGGKKIVKEKSYTIFFRNSSYNEKYDTRCQVICVIMITKIILKEKNGMARPRTKDDLNTYMKSKEGV